MKKHAGGGVPPALSVASAAPGNFGLEKQVGGVPPAVPVASDPESSANLHTPPTMMKTCRGLQAYNTNQRNVFWKDGKVKTHLEKFTPKRAC